MGGHGQGTGPNLRRPYSKLDDPRRTRRSFDFRALRWMRAERFGWGPQRGSARFEQRPLQNSDARRMGLRRRCDLGSGRGAGRLAVGGHAGARPAADSERPGHDRSRRQLPWNEIAALLVDHDGALWVAFDRHGIARLYHGKVDFYDTARGSTQRSLHWRAVRGSRGQPVDRVCGCGRGAASRRQIHGVRYAGRPLRQLHGQCAAGAGRHHVDRRRR